jgi:hypothetical protein
MLALDTWKVLSTELRLMLLGGRVSCDLQPGPLDKKAVVSPMVRD